MEARAGCQVEAPLVERARQGAAGDVAEYEWVALVGARVPDRVWDAVDDEDRDLRPAEVDYRTPVPIERGEGNADAPLHPA